MLISNVLNSNSYLLFRNFLLPLIRTTFNSVLTFIIHQVWNFHALILAISMVINFSSSLWIVLILFVLATKKMKPILSTMPLLGIFSVVFVMPLSFVLCHHLTHMSSILFVFDCLNYMFSTLLHLCHSFSSCVSIVMWDFAVFILCLVKPR